MSERTTTTAETSKPTNGVTRTGASPSGAVVKTDTGPITVVPDTPAPAAAEGSPTGTSTAEGSAPSVARPDQAPGGHVTAPVTVRPKVRGPRRGPLTRMGPWAPVAGALIGLFGGLIAVLFLAGAAVEFTHRLALVFAVVGLGMLGAAGTLLADEVRMVRQSAREAAVRPAWVEATAPLLAGLTPARLLLLVSTFVLFLAAYVAR
jgi:hypothetical protein